MRGAKYAFPFDERVGDSPPYTSAGSTDVADGEMADGAGRREDAPTEEEPQEGDAR